MGGGGQGELWEGEMWEYRDQGKSPSLAHPHGTLFGALMLLSLGKYMSGLSNCLALNWTDFEKSVEKNPVHFFK